MFSNFTIKQALPRLIIAAIAINFSYALCALLVDTSNLLGQSIFALLKSLHGEVMDSTSLIALVELVLAGGVTASAGTAVVGGAVAAAFIAGVGTQLLLGVILMFVSFLLGIALAIFIALLILAARQALIIILVVVAPIAFAFYILPGTKSLFDRWRKLLTTMLVFFPLFALLYGGAQLAAGILIAASGNFTGADAAKLGGVFLLMGIGAQFLPLFATPWLLKNGSGELGKMASKLQQKAKPLTQAPGKWGRNRVKDVAGVTASAAQKNFRDFTARRRGSGRRRDAILDRLAHGGDRLDMRKEALKGEMGRQKSEFSERDDEGRELHERAGNAGELTKASESRLEGHRLNTGAGRTARQTMTTTGEDLKTTEAEVESDRLGANAPAGTVTAGAASRMAMTNAQKDVKTQEARVDTTRLGTAAGQHTEHEHHEAEDLHKAAELDVETVGLRTVAGAQARQTRIIAEDVNKTAETDVQTASLRSIEGREARQNRGNAEDLNKATTIDVETSRRRDTATGKDAVAAVQTAELRKKIEDSDRERDHLTDHPNDYLKVTAAQSELDVAKAGQQQIEVELKTDEGYRQHVTNGGTPGIDVAAAQTIKNMAADKSIVADATESANRVFVAEEAKRIVGNPGIAAAAGGVDPYGAARATAVAKNKALEQMRQIVGQEKSTMSEIRHSRPNPSAPIDPVTNPAGLIDIVKDTTQSVERRAAAAGMIAANGYRDGHLELLEYIGDPANHSSDMVDIQQQALADMSAVPTVVGDTMRSDLKNGVLSITPRTIPDAITGVPQPVSIREEMMLQRLDNEKFSEKSLSVLDPDEVKILDSLYRKGVIDPARRGSAEFDAVAYDHFESVISRLREPGNTYYGSTKDAQRKVFDRISPP